MQHVLTILFDLAALAGALGVGQGDVRAIMTDARIATPIVQRRIAADHPDWKLVKGRGGSDELRDPEGGIWRVKSITDTTSFPPSAQIGSSREVDPKEVVANWRALSGYILLDLARFPTVTVQQVPIANIQRWYAAGRLGAKAQIRRAALTGLLGDVRFAR